MHQAHLFDRWLLMDRPDRFPLSTLLDVLTSLGVPLDMPQIECYIANIMQMVRPAARSTMVVGSLTRVTEYDQGLHVE